MNVHLHSVLDEFQMLREYATRHALASQKGQRKTNPTSSQSDPSLRALPAEQGRDPEKEKTTRATENLGREKKSTSGETSRGVQVRDLHGVFPDRTSQTGAFIIREHLPTSRESKELEISFAPDEDVLLSPTHTRQVSLRLPSHSVRMQTSSSETRMAVSSLSDQPHPRSVTTLSPDSQRASASCSGTRPEELVQQLATLPEPVLHAPFMDPITLLICHHRDLPHLVIVPLLLFGFLYHVV